MSNSPDIISLSLQSSPHNISCEIASSRAYAMKDLLWGITLRIKTCSVALALVRQVQRSIDTTNPFGQISSRSA